MNNAMSRLPIKLFKKRQTLNKTIKKQTAVRRGEALKKTKLIEQDLDALSENQTDSHICSHSNRLADMLAALQMSYGQHHYFTILSIFLYDILIASQQGNIQQLPFKCRHLKCIAFITHT